MKKLVGFLHFVIARFACSIEYVQSRAKSDRTVLKLQGIQKTALIIGDMSENTKIST